MQADGETICRHKAHQAYKALKQPLVVNDDSWSIPGLNGFPGAYMKYMNGWLSSDDWLRLTAPLPDRRIILQQHIVYQDEHGQQHFLKNIEGQLMDSVHGTHDFGHLAIASFDGGKMSGAERVAAGMPAVEQSTDTAWDQLADWLKAKSA